MNRRNFLKRMGESIAGIVAVKIGVTNSSDDRESLFDFEEYTSFVPKQKTLSPGAVMGTFCGFGYDYSTTPDYDEYDYEDDTGWDE